MEMCSSVTYLQDDIDPLGQNLALESRKEITLALESHLTAKLLFQQFLKYVIMTTYCFFLFYYPGWHFGFPVQ